MSAFFTPREIVSELDRFIVGQQDAKRAVASRRNAIADRVLCSWLAPMSGPPVFHRWLPIPAGRTLIALVTQAGQAGITEGATAAFEHALRVALPGGPPVPVFAPKPGQYMLIDQTRDYMRSDLYVLNYPTFDVTGLDGKFDITGVPVGKVKVSAYAPALGKVVEQSVEIEAGADKALSFELAFSESEYRERLRDSPAPGDTASKPHPQ